MLATCSFPRSTTLDEAVFRAERDAAEGLHNVSVADLTNQFCTAGLCEPMRDGLVVYRDTNHLTVAFSRSLSGVLADEIDPAALLGGRQRPN